MIVAPAIFLSPKFYQGLDQNTRFSAISAQIHAAGRTNGGVAGFLPAKVPAGSGKFFGRNRLSPAENLFR